MSRYTLDWSFGLRNCAGKYLTAETFGFKIVCAAGIMKKKQIWFLEQKDDAVSFRSHLGKYLTCDGDGKFQGNADSVGEEEQWIIEAQKDGRWLLKNKKYGWYAGGTGENLTCFTKDASEDRMWTVHLAMHPQVCIRNVNRKRYMHLVNNQLCCDEDIPWGHDATINLTFFDDGRYGLRASDGTFLSATGALKAEADDSCKFIIEFANECVSFRSSSDKYVTALGASGLVKASKASISKDEQFIMEDSWPQISLRANNGKLVSTKQGVEIAATQMNEMTDYETYQIEPQDNGKWILKSSKEKLFKLVEGGLSNEGSCEGEPAADCQFDIEFDGPNMRLRASNGKYVQQQNNGYLKAAVDSPDDKCNFIFQIINRPQLILRGDFGFVSALPSGLLECNKSTPETFHMKATKEGYYEIAGGNGKYWKTGDNGVSVTGGSPEQYTIQLHKESKLTLHQADKMFAGQQNGSFTCTGGSVDKSTLFEY
jgi:fascin 1/2